MNWTMRKDGNRRATLRVEFYITPQEMVCVLMARGSYDTDIMRRYTKNDVLTLVREHLYMRGMHDIHWFASKWDDVEYANNAKRWLLYRTLIMSLWVDISSDEISMHIPGAPTRSDDND